MNPGTIVCVTHCFLCDIARAYISRTAVCQVFGRALDIAYIAHWTDAVRVIKKQVSALALVLQSVSLGRTYADKPLSSQCAGFLKYIIAEWHGLQSQQLW